MGGTFNEIPDHWEVGVLGGSHPNIRATQIDQEIADATVLVPSLKRTNMLHWWSKLENTFPLINDSSCICSQVYSLEQSLWKKTFPSGDVPRYNKGHSSRNSKHLFILTPGSEQVIRMRNWKVEKLFSLSWVFLVFSCPYQSSGPCIYSWNEYLFSDYPEPVMGMGAGDRSRGKRGHWVHLVESAGIH